MVQDSDQILAAVLSLPLQERLRLVERVIHDMTESSSSPSPKTPAHSVIGSLEGEADVLDGVRPSPRSAPRWRTSPDS